MIQVGDKFIVNGPNLVPLWCFEQGETKATGWLHSKETIVVTEILQGNCCKVCNLDKSGVAIIDSNFQKL